MKKYLNIEFSWTGFNPTDVVTEENFNEVERISDDVLKLDLLEDHGVIRMALGEEDSKLGMGFIATLQSMSFLLSIGVATTKYLHRDIMFDATDLLLTIQHTFSNLGVWFTENSVYPYGDLPIKEVLKPDNDENFYIRLSIEDM